MGSESTPPKLSLFSLPSVEPPGMLTPPIKPLASVPFQWEEAPGKPRPTCLVGGDNKPKNVVKCLELPPRLLIDQAKVSACMPSPTTVLEGPNGGSMSFRFWSPAAEKERVLFGSSRWGSFKKNNNNNKNNKEVGGGFDFLFPDVTGEGDTIGAPSDDVFYRVVKITTVKKKNSFSQSKSHYLLGSIYESLKQVVPFSWSRRRKEKLRKKGS